MTGWFFTRIALAALFGVVVGAAIAVRMERNGKERNGGRSRVYWAYSYAGCIPLFILAVWLLNWAFYGADQAMDVLLALWQTATPKQIAMMSSMIRSALEASKD